ncbi:unnamed protein product, partial [Didymodactylos carnosus]
HNSQLNTGDSIINSRKQKQYTTDVSSTPHRNSALPILSPSIKNPPTSSPSPAVNWFTSFPTLVPVKEIKMTSDTNSLLNMARKNRYNELDNFSGLASDDAEKFLKSIKNIFKTDESLNDRQKLEIIRDLFEFEIAFVSRYSSSLNKLTKFDKLLQRKQQDNESVTNYYDEIVPLCREVDVKMSESTIIQHLLTGVKSEFRKELFRQSPFESLINFLQAAKKEEDLQKTLEKSLNTDFKTEQPYFTFNIQRESTVQDNVYRHPNSSFRNQRSFVNPLQKSNLSNTHPSANRNQPSSSNKTEQQNR